MVEVANKNQKIVIIEGNQSVGEQLVLMLKNDGYTSVYHFKTGAEGIQGVYDLLPHLIVLDIVLPDMDGYQVLGHKQSEPLLSKIPVFLLSMHGVAINMRNIPEGSVAEVIISLNAKNSDILQKINDYFGYGVSEIAESNKPTSIKKKILWIEDDKLIGNILEKKLISSGFDLTHVRDGEAALEEVKTLVPDIIIIDLILPGMNGFDILESMNKIDSLRSVPRMVLSNLSKVADIDKAKSLGAVKYLVKASTSLDQVIKEVKDIIK